MYRTPSNRAVLPSANEVGSRIMLDRGRHTAQDLEQSVERLAAQAGNGFGGTSSSIQKHPMLGGGV